jgi:hypothetical protein
MDVLAGGGRPVAAVIWRYPQARPRKLGGVWWVDPGPAVQQVLPAGVDVDNDVGNQPTRLKATLHELVSDLRLTATMPSREEAAGHLAAHVATFGMPDLCGPHGLPMLHGRRSGGPSCTYGTLPESESLGVSVEHVIRLVNFLDALIDATDELMNQRKGISVRVVEDILGFPVLSHSYSSSVRAELTNYGHLQTGRARQLVCSALEGFMQASGLRITMRWEPQRRPELALVADTTVALYAADTLADIGASSGSRSYVCQSCGQPVTLGRAPRAGDGIFCRRPECQRERNRAKVARHRSRNGRQNG